MISVWEICPCGSRPPLFRYMPPTNGFRPKKSLARLPAGPPAPELCRETHLVQFPSCPETCALEFEFCRPPGLRQGPIGLDFPGAPFPQHRPVARRAQLQEFPRAIVQGAARAGSKKPPTTAPSVAAFLFRVSERDPGLFFQIRGGSSVRVLLFPCIRSCLFVVIKDTPQEFGALLSRSLNEIRFLI